jgi:mono/diheme cytochrome c family protein
MKSALLAASLAALCSATLVSADQATLEKGKAEEASSCVACHGLKIIHNQRLSKSAWDRELDKMQRWGATIENRGALLEYLTTNFGDNKPAPPPELTGDGTKAGTSQKN